MCIYLYKNKNMANALRNVFEIFLTGYAVIKYTFNKILPTCNNKNWNMLLGLLNIVFALLLYAIVVLIVTPFVIIRQTLDVYLRYKYGKKYKGLLKYMDAMWMAESEGSKHIMCGIIVVQLKDSPEEFLDHLRSKLRDSQRIQSNTTVHNILNYWYRVQSDNVVERVVRIIDLSEDERRYKDKFEEKFSRLSNTSLPKDTAYEFLLSSRPVLCFNTENPDDSIHVMIVRIHHSVIDGRNLLRFILENLCDRVTVPKEIKAIQPDEKSHLFMSRKQCDYLEEIKNTFEYMKNIPDILRNSFMYRLPLIDACDDNILHGPQLSGEKILVFHIEDKPGYVAKIKAIKSRFDGCRFSDVLYTSLSASLWKYFEEHDVKNFPTDAHITFTTSFIKELNHIQDLDYLNSTFFSAVLDLPIKIDETNMECGNLISKLKIIMARSKLQRQSLDLLGFYWFIRHFHFLPSSIMKYFFSAYSRSTAIISNVPGIDAITMKGQNMKDLVIWMPNVATIGLGMSILSYDGRLQISLIVDKALISTSTEASAILKNFYKYLDLLEEEVNRSM